MEGSYDIMVSYDRQRLGTIQNLPSPMIEILKTETNKHYIVHEYHFPHNKLVFLPPQNKKDQYIIHSMATNASSKFHHLKYSPSGLSN